MSDCEKPRPDVENGPGRETEEIHGRRPEKDSFEEVFSPLKMGELFGLR